MTKGVSVGIGAELMARDFGSQMGFTVCADSSAALGITQRRGIGKIRHLATQTLWVQSKHTQGQFVIKKVKGTHNIADLGTKSLDEKNFERFRKQAGFELRTDESRLAKKIKS